MARAKRILIVEAPYYQDIVGEMARGAIEVLNQAGATFERLTVPGAFELPGAVRFAQAAGAQEPAYDGYIVLGCVIRGETSHYDLITEECTRALQEMVTRDLIALGFGLLTTENYEQAEERARVDRQNKGAEAAQACLRMVELKDQFRLSPR